MSNALAAGDAEVAFTFDRYGALLDELQSADRRFRTYDEAVERGDVLLRHDVDWAPRRALRMARLEADRGVTATYFFLVSSPFYNLMHKPCRLVLREIQDLGHEVDLHFSTHQYFEAEPADEALVERVDEERTVLERLVDDPVDVVSFHRPPEWVYRRSYDGFVSTYETRFFEDIAYRGDSNQRWRDDPPLADGVPEKMQVLVHPGLWGESDAGFVERLRAHERRRLGRTADFMEEQFVEKRYNIDDYCEFVEE